MTADAWGVLILLAITIALFIWDKLRMDLVALMVVVVLALSGWVTPAEAVFGSGNSLVVMIAALFIVGEGLFQTGLAARAGLLLLRVGGTSEARILWALLPMVALMSAFMSSTGAVALFIPVVLTLARRSGINPGRLMMPLAFASLIGGMLTLIGTPPNLVVANQMKASGVEPFAFFDFTLVGGAIFIVGTLYLIYVARFFLPEAPEGEERTAEPHLADLAKRYGIEDQLHRLRVQPGSSLIGKTVSEAGLRTHFDITLFGIRRQGRLVSSLMPVLSETRIQPWDHLLVYGSPEAIDRLCQACGIAREGFPSGEMGRVNQEFGAAEVIVRRFSPLIGKTLKEARLRDRIGLSVIGVRRNNEPMAADFQNTRIDFGDTLLLVGGWRYIEALQNNRDFVILETPAEMHEASRHGEKSPWALTITLAMLVLMITGWVSTLTASLIAALAMILTGCVRMDEAYRSFNATSLVLIAGMLPLAKAMSTTGALDALVSGVTHLAEGQSPHLLLAVFFLITSVLSQFISNTATTVLVAPIGMATAQSLGIQPEPVLMTIALAASTAFATPIASPVNTLVIAPGHYRFLDFVKVGIPLQILSMILILLLTPVFFPF
ncbi:MAG: SLC13 family permease [Gammaproteobacteria bacterium]|nr:MAG: SLC13 family permease [Gammaproteobacteria bacterium]